MRIIILSLLLLSCSQTRVAENTADQEQLRSELKNMDAALTDLTYEVHKPIYFAEEL